MSDPRFARLKSDPRFRRIKKERSKVVVDERFKGVFDAGKKKGKGKGKGRVDKYGRPIAEDQERDNLRRFYRLEDEDRAEPEPKIGLDYARGEVLLESSDEEDEAGVQEPEDDDSDTGGVIALGRDVVKPALVEDEGVEVDLDEDTFAELDAQVEAYARENPENEAGPSDVQRTRRLALVNLDWDHVRAVHLYKILSSLVSTTAPPASSLPNPDITSKSKGKAPSTRLARGKVLSVRVYLSEFGKERMAREEKEGPPPEIFKKKSDDDEINERTIFETGDENDYDEDALRKYQLERLRYYYAIVECDTVEAASHIYSELEGAELERSANVFDLSFVPNDMKFDGQYRDEATDDLSVPYKGLEFVTDALRHSKVKLTWDEEDPDRVQITRRNLSRKEIEENDFKAYLASSTSGSEDEDEGQPKRADKSASRDKLRALLLGGGDDALPEGWGKDAGGGDDVDMEITFTPGLSEAKEDREETTLEKYQRKMKEKKKKRKDEMRERRGPEKESVVSKDEFFADGSDEDEDEGEDEVPRGKKDRRSKKPAKGEPVTERAVSTTEELALLATSDSTEAEPKHFNMKAVLKAEKLKKLKGKAKKKAKKSAEDENELQEDFAIDVQDERFAAMHENHAFAIDPSNPHFKQTKSMSALLEERSKRQKQKRSEAEEFAAKRSRDVSGEGNLQQLVERVKRKSAAVREGTGKRRKF